MFNDMLDVSSQMSESSSSVVRLPLADMFTVLRWDRLGEHFAIDASDDFTRLAFDTIGLCSFGYRFNEFYTDEVHPFAKQMAEVLKMSGRRASRPPIANRLFRWEEQERQRMVKSMHDLVQEIVRGAQRESTARC